LIDQDLVLTAGHCVKSASHCAGLRFVFDYHYEASGIRAAISPEDVHGCRRLVVREYVREPDRHLDYAVVQLDRPASADRVPVTLRSAPGPVATGSRVIAIGYPAGVPAKIDDGGRVLDAREGDLDYFHASTDTFAGSSGSGVFDEGGRLVGVLVQGGEDFVQECGCTVTRRVPDDGGRLPGESVGYVGPAVDALCGTGWTSERVCGRPPVCGDDLCTAGESADACPDDCFPAGCGNGVCELGEDPGCDADCSTGSSGEVPADWTCAEATYGAEDGCDCACGAPDPDCDDPGAAVYNCWEPDEVCSPEGQCVAPGDGEVPSTWGCDPSYYDAGDGCDCGCGSFDPDCDDEAQELFGCEPGRVCGPDGRCVAP
jgi:hypothetical protein